MKFASKEHQKFWLEKFDEMIQLRKTDVYYKSIIYTLGMCETTRKNFDDIFNLKSGEINIDALQGKYQTGTSKKVTRLAFSLWNGCNYDKEQDIEIKIYLQIIMLVKFFLVSMLHIFMKQLRLDILNTQEKFQKELQKKIILKDKTK